MCNETMRCGIYTFVEDPVYAINNKIRLICTRLWREYCTTTINALVIWDLLATHKIITACSLVIHQNYTKDNGGSKGQQEDT